MRRALLVAAAALAVAAPAALAVAGPAAGARRPACPNANTRAGRASAGALRAAVLCLVNRERTSRHLPALHESARLDRSAQGWSRHLVAAGVFTHGDDPGARISAAGYRWSTWGENIATGYATPRAVVSGWMHSAGHCRNILDPAFRDVGVGVVARGVRPYRGATWTEDFGLARGARPPSRNFGPADRCPY